MIISGGNNLTNNRDLVDRLNVFPVPDGDTGTNMSLTINYALKELEKVTQLTVSNLSKAVSKGSLMGARGNSGVILSQILRGLAKGLEGKEDINIEDLAVAFKESSDTAYKAVIKPIEGTILTVVRESGEYAIENYTDEKDIKVFFEKILNRSLESLNNTPNLLKVLKEANVVDSGGKGLFLFYEGMYKALIGEKIDLKEKDEQEENKNEKKSIAMDAKDIKFLYCTEFILQTTKITYNEIKEKIEDMGDSLVVVGDEDIIKVHIHTNNPGKALEIATAYGELKTIKIENMKDQHENTLLEMDEAKKEVAITKKYGIISVSMGEGINKILKDFNVDHIISGGQTMNPSTNDFMDAINKIPAENIIIYPNNSNIIMAANQTKTLTDKNIIVIPTKNVFQNFVSLMSFNEELEVEEIEEILNEDLDSPKVGQVTYAVRKTNINGLDINVDDIIGIGQKEIKVCGSDINEVSIDLVKSLIDEDSEMITLLYGEDINEEKANEMVEELEGLYPNLDIELYYGGQPVYYYMFSIE
ncbi:MAG: DAK2 domain-containing protein [Peptostreptococcaceae bacterium]|jgi:DAK2 domain fusion protein YloV|nr:DAK2 domain-containing protein [Peptostreptococcaceae bacterium]